MKIERLACVAVASALLAMPSALLAHGGSFRGGRYTGPGDTVPKNPGGGGGSTPSPGGPTTPTPGGPSTPTPSGPSTPGPGAPPPPVPTGGPGAPGPGRGGPTTGGGGGITLADDLDEWKFWWEFNKDPYLQLKQAIHVGGITTGSDDFIMGRGIKEDPTDTLKPTQRDRAQIITELKKALENTTNRDVISACLVALAKIGGDTSILPLFKKFLPDNDQEKRETAALALGIAALEEAVPDLLALAKDTPEGRKLCQRAEVDYRTRSFACYGLGLVAHRTKNQDLKRTVYETMKELVDAGTKRTRRDIIIAGLQTMRLLDPDPKTEAGKKLRDDALAYLVSYMDRSDKEIYAHVRSHSYLAVAALIGRGGDTDGKITKKMIADIENRKQKQWIHQSAILALGQIALPDDDRVSTALQSYMKKGKNIQGKNFCAIVLGQIGGSKNRSFLITNLKRSKSILKPWLALGLAVMDYNIREKDQNYEGDQTAAQAIKQQFDKMKNPLYAAGIGLALGVMRYNDSGPDLMDRLEKVKNIEVPAGYIAVALGLMRHQDSLEQINALVDRSTRRDVLLTQCSIALGLLGDKEIGMKLIRRMQVQGNVVAVQSALAQALGYIGDRRSIRPLIEMMHNKSLKNIPRAFAAVALGLVGDKEPLPWNSKIAVNNNYRATIETLTGHGMGILDIL